MLAWQTRRNGNLDWRLSPTSVRLVSLVVALYDAGITEVNKKIGGFRRNKYGFRKQNGLEAIGSGF
jgi:hypothetical protein